MLKIGRHIRSSEGAVWKVAEVLKSGVDTYTVTCEAPSLMTKVPNMAAEHLRHAIRRKTRDRGNQDQAADLRRVRSPSEPRWHPSTAATPPMGDGGQAPGATLRRSTPGASWPIIEWVRGRRFKSYTAAFSDSESVSHRYAFMARSRRHAEHEAREMAARWRYTLIGIELDRRGKAQRRSLLAVAGFAFAVAGTAITVVTVFALSLVGAL